MTSQSESLGQLIRRQRAAHKMTQSRVAELVGRSPSTVRNWERDRSIPSDMATLNTLAAILSISDEELSLAVPSYVGQEAHVAESTSLIASLESEPEAPRRPSASPAVEIVDPPSVIDEAHAEDEVHVEDVQPAHEAADVVDLDAPAMALDVEDLEVPEGAPDVEDAERSTQDIEPDIPEGVPVERDGVQEPSDEEPAVSDVFESARGLASSVEPEAAKTDTPKWQEIWNRSRSSRAVSQVGESYLSDPDEARFYRNRAMAVTAVLFGMLLILMWSFGRFQESITSLFG